MVDQSIKVTIKLTTSAETFTITITPTQTVSQIKDELCATVNTPAERLKLIYKAKVLNDT